MDEETQAPVVPEVVPPVAPEVAAAPESIPEAAPVPIAQAPIVPTAEHFDARDGEFATALQQGKIKPQTYHDLYADKSIPGKVGTLFGLLVGGLGSGLTHQPNVVLQMMDNQIKNDLEAQKASQENAANWYRLSQAHAKQQAEIPLLGAQTEEAKQRAGVDKANIDLVSSNAALNRMRLAAFQGIQNSVNDMAPSPRQQAAQATLNNVVGPALMQSVKQTNAQTAAQLQARQALSPQQNSESAPEDTAVDMGKFNLLKAAGEQAAALGVPGRPGKSLNPDQLAKATQEIELVQKNRKVASMFKDSFDKLNNLTGSKEYPDLRAAEINSLMAQIARQTTGGYNTGEAESQAKAMFPEPGDLPSTRKEKFRKGMEHFESQESGTPVLDSLKLKKSFPYKTKEDAPEQQVKVQGPDGSTRMVPSSQVQKYVQKGGKIIK